jgi:hypothetical protein
MQTSDFQPKYIKMQKLKVLLKYNFMIKMTINYFIILIFLLILLSMNHTK